MTPDWIVNLTESERLELKGGRVDPDIIGRHICAFANAQGGTILIGITEPARLVGVPDRDRLIEKIHDWIMKDLSPQLSVSVVPMDVEEVPLVAIDIPQGASRPYTWKRAIYVRVGGATRQADGAMITEMLLRPSTYLWERQIAVGIDERAIDDKELKHAWNDVSNKRLGDLRTETWPGICGALQHFDLADNSQIFNGGLVLFSKTPSTRLPQTRVRAVTYQDEQGQNLVDNQCFEGHAFYLIERIMDFLKKHIPLQSQIPYNTIRRQEHPAIPFVALREAVLNAIQHRDYEAFDGGISLVLRPSILDIWNSGSLPEGMTVDDLKVEHHSRPHNPGIAHVFFLRGFVERIGSGSTRMVDECRRAGLPDPEWRQISGGVSVLFRFADITGDLIERQRDLLNSLVSGETITVGAYAERSNISERQARTDLTQLVKRGYFRRVGAGPSTRYERSTKEMR